MKSGDFGPFVALEREESGGILRKGSEWDVWVS